jgi:Flp pilus assembly pilin Flp
MRHHHPTAPRRSRSDDERGASLVEYALLLALIAVVVFGAVSFFGSETGAGFGGSASCIKAAYDDTLVGECP